MIETVVATADDLAAWAAEATPFDGFLTPFGGFDVPELSEVGRVDALVALQRLRSWIDAQEARLFAATVAADGEKGFALDEIGCALRLSAGVVAERAHVGTELVDRLPATLAMLESGAITGRHAQALVDAVSLLDAGIATRVEQRVLSGAAEQTPAAFRRSVRRAVASCDAAGVEERHERAMIDRRVCVTPTNDGMAELWALLPADGAASLLAALNGVAGRRVAGDERTAGQRRADALVGLAAQQLTDPSLPAWQGRRPAVQVTVAATTLLGMDDEPAELDGFGPLPASIARAIAADPSGTWQRLLTDPVGQLVDCSRRYRPAAPLAEFVMARDRTCRFPRCPRPARRTELDHQIPWEDGGTTTADNLECLCSRHHHLKHQLIR
ncbi:HNH endonuclease [Jatrophihabitans endophyticus]|uniref:HNH endonuclease n=1 Tax=Jatrophihabitans endophyticus TaxID=1206085 RepID=A0A1M5TSD9_9ACTN|nr:HNH endonuclease signature motif containing protein [Jatrophihabitans endophyticus]SHH53578.1 HNH endonuclease [Jatrophihabitans endophyticus]